MGLEDGSVPRGERRAKHPAEKKEPRRLPAKHARRQDNAVILGGDRATVYRVLRTERIQSKNEAYQAGPVTIREDQAVVLKGRFAEEGQGCRRWSSVSGFQGNAVEQRVFPSSLNSPDATRARLPSAPEPAPTTSLDVHLLRGIEVL